MTILHRQIWGTLRYLSKPVFAIMHNGSSHFSNKNKDTGQLSSDSTSKRARAASRTLRACDACRKLKSRCYKATTNAVCCSRCRNLGHTCSLEVDFKAEHPNVPIVNGEPHMPTNPMNKYGIVQTGASLTQDQNTSSQDLRNKIDLIYLGVAELLSAVKSDGALALKGDMKQLIEAINSKNRPPSASLSSSNMNSSGSSHSIFDLGSNNNNSSMNISESEKFFESPHVIEPDLESDPASLCSAAKLFQISPFCIVTRQMPDVPQPILNLLNLLSFTQTERKVDNDIIDAKILSEVQVIELMKEFRSNYGRWVLFPIQMFTDELIRQLRRKSPFLLTTCCTISLRYLLNNKSGQLDSNEALTYGSVFNHMRKDLQKAILKYTMGMEDFESDIEFLQAMVIISIYLFSLSAIASQLVESGLNTKDIAELRNLKMDPWNLSGLALNKFVSSSCFGTLLRSKNVNYNSPDTTYPTFDNDETQKITVFRTYNHLILIHLVSCILTGRMCVVDEIRLRHCNLSLGLHSATNFDGRMVSEISILLITYNYIQLNLNTDSVKTLNEVEESFLVVKLEVDSWYDQWEYLFRQPALQFVVFCYNFCYIQILFCYLHTKSLITTMLPSRHTQDYTAFVNIDIIHILFNYSTDETLAKILYHSFHLVNFVLLVEDDLYFAYLSDQIYFFFYFGAIVLIKITKHLLDHEKLYCMNNVKDATIDEKNWQAALTPITLLIEKFSRVAQNNAHDIITKYRLGIEKCFEENFSGLR